jgi:hypothetical protein
MLMNHTCPECGAVYQEGDSCQAIFDSFLVLEFSDPAYGEVHFLTVACYMVQHGRYSDEGLGWIEKTLRAHLEQGIPVEHIRQQAGKETQQGTRTWKVTRQAGDTPLSRIDWSMTIADVTKNYMDAESYCTLIRKWAGITVKEMQPWLTRR